MTCSCLPHADKYPENLCGECRLEKRIAELEAIKLWPDEDDRYLYGKKPDTCLYRQFPEEYAMESSRVFEHGDHLTRENLRGKWELAAELAWRDEQLSARDAELARLREAAMAVHTATTQEQLDAAHVRLWEALEAGGE